MQLVVQILLESNYSRIEIQIAQCHRVLHNVLESNYSRIEIYVIIAKFIPQM